jgi:hypothetical protein
MAISLQCEQCGKQYKLADNLAGKRLKCKQCGNTISVPAATSPGAASPAAAVPTASKGAPPAAAATIKAKCETCFKEFEVPPEKAGDTVPCERCGEPVRVPGKGKTRRAAPEPTASTRTASAAAPAPNMPRQSLIEEEFAAGGMPTMPTAGQMFCPNCRNIIPVNAVLCVKCGFKIESGRMMTAKNAANKPVRKPGRMSPMGILLALLGILYGLANIGLWGFLGYGAVVVLYYYGMPREDNPQSATAMFGFPVFLLLFTAGCLLINSCIGILRKLKGAIPNAALASKIFVWSFVVGVTLSFGSTIYQQYVSKPKEGEQQTTSKKKKDEAPPPPMTGPAKLIMDLTLSMELTGTVIASALGILTLLVTPPLLIWIWAGTQGKRIDWELPEPLYKATKKKSTGAPPDPTKKPPVVVGKGGKK